jgi:hypothetical protein
MKLLTIQDDRERSSRDSAERGYPLRKLEQLVSDCESQPDWRWKADRACRMYDMGKQLTPEMEHKIRRDWGIEPRQTNLIHGVINSLLGQEARARTDVNVEADTDDYADLAEYFGVQMEEARRESFADMAVSEAYASQVKAGVGWVGVTRASDPLDYPYRVEFIHRNEIWWDMRGTDLGLKDARWQVRVRWMDLELAEAMMPEHAEVLRQTVGGWSAFMLPDEDGHLAAAYRNERGTSIRRDQWLDSARKRIKFYEVWYRAPAEVVVLHLSPTKRVIYDKENPLHVQAVARGRVKLSKSITNQVRKSLFAGPHRLDDEGTARRNFPYVPFFAFRDDEDGSPYGLVEGMISPQEEYNERRQMINWMLKARQIQMDSDALDPKYNTIKDITQQVMRPDMVAITNPGRINRGQGVKVEANLAMQKEQLDVMQDAKQLIQDVPRVYSTQLGNAPAGVTSGVAINSLSEAGAVAMGELNDNYTFGRRLVHEELLSLIAEDHLQEEMQVSIGTGSSRRVIVLNSWTPEGAPVNRVKDSPVKVGLSDIPNSPAHRMQEMQHLSTAMTAMGNNPAAVGVLAPAYIEASSLPGRAQIAKQLRQISGLPEMGDKNAQEEQQEQAQQAAQQAQEMNMRAAAAKVAKDEAAATKTMAEAQEIQGRAALAPAQAVAANEDQILQQVMAEAAR